ncbi:hypothetical protein CBM2615_B200101 [Cupriavidus taiwanensis]|uniref:Uncharacterized protein n=1 Tax=Cupriavidus taiwanensis TaxID=164546 RepID=A0A375ED75_9BURK|nr:hypothetical protein CBM2614_B210101 [Cupriavidus taiwanensis]SOZ68626.1 hypothetical protein CBM2615_B200101 [Cupriavidus taiwanensis]SOZ71638.1 hypothetical protein CBM2613_B180100 [Cupriavidus taiwanensis]SPA09439.1 hypothetical protein CBM2625_B180100 [Cupriavidus taiwanensis]
MFSWKACCRGRDWGCGSLTDPRRRYGGGGISRAAAALPAGMVRRTAPRPLHRAFCRLRWFVTARCRAGARRRSWH